MIVTFCESFVSFQGKCQKTVQDVVERFWNIIEDIDINTVLILIKDNIVGTVIIISVIIWIPASCIFAYVDRRRQEEYRRYDHWYHSNELVHPSDNVRVINSKRTRYHEPECSQKTNSANRIYQARERDLLARHPPEGAESRYALGSPQSISLPQSYSTDL